MRLSWKSSCVTPKPLAWQTKRSCGSEPSTQTISEWPEPASPFFRNLFAVRIVGCGLSFVCRDSVGIEIEARDRIGLPVMELVDAADEQCGAASDRRPDVRRDVIHLKTEPARAGRISLGAVDRPLVVERRFA